MKSVPQRMPKLARLRAFHGVVLSGAMSGAAGRLHVSQPAVTRSVLALEREFGTRLLERTYRGSFLTDAGQVFARRIARAFRQIEEALANLAGLPPSDGALTRMSRRLADPQIRGVIAIARAGTFRRAAAALRLSEPSLHRAARNLERIAGVPLFRRSAEGWALSPAGTDFARRLALALTEIRAGIEEIGAGGASRMQITLGALPLAPKQALAAAVEQQLKRHPNVRVTVLEARHDDLVARLRSGEVDFIYGALRDPSRFDDVAEEPLFEDAYAIVCRAGHPLTKGGRISRASFKRFDWIFPAPTLPRRAVLDALIDEWGLRSRVQLETDSIGLIVASLARSDRLALLPHAFTEAGADLARLRVIATQRTRTVGITARRDWLPTPAQSDLLRFLREQG